MSFLNETDDDNIWSKIVNPLIFGNLGPAGVFAQPAVNAGKPEFAKLLQALSASVNKGGQQPISPLANPDAAQIANDPTIQHATGIQLPGSANGTVVDPKIYDNLEEAQSSPLNPQEQAFLAQQNQPASPLAPQSVSGTAAKSAPEANDFIKNFQELLKNQQNDTYRSALLHAGAALMGPGSFGTQLGRGIEAGASALDKGDETKLGGAKSLAELGIKANDTKNQATLLRALSGQTSVTNTDSAKKAALAQKVAEDIMQPPEKRKAAQDIVDQYTGATKAIPDRNIGNILTAPPPLEERVNGNVYQTPKGPMIWDGKKWIPQG